MTAEPVAQPSSSARTLPIIAMVAGGLILGYGLVILAPLVPTAAWTGVLDSAQVGHSSEIQFPGRDTRNSLTLFLRGAPAGRTLTLPGSTAVSTESLKSGDTVRALVGWATLRDAPSAVNLTSGSVVLVDSTVVLGAERTQRSRIALAGAVILILGLVGVMRNAPRKPPEQRS